MKKTTRLTALLVSLVLLLGTLSASATGFAEGIPFGEFDLSWYETILSDAETVGLSASQPCGKSNPYCASVVKIADLATEQERYDYLASLTSVEAIGVLMHYHDYHEAENTVCLCAYPNFDAAYVPGNIDHDAACPWHFANMTASNQYYILNKLDADTQSEYKATLTEAQLKKLEVFVREISYLTPCDPDTCPMVDEYVDFFSMDVFYVYEYLSEMYYNTIDDAEDREKFLNLWSHLRDNHIADNVVCQCGGCDFENADHRYGRDHHKMGYEVEDLYIVCPWRIDQMTIEEQALVVNELGGSIPAYFSDYLTEAEMAELTAFLNGVGKTEATVPSEDSAVTVEISVPANVFGADVNHVMDAGEAQLTTEKVRALNEALVGHTLAAFDITFYNLDRPGVELQPVNGTIPLTFTVDVSEAEGDMMQVYHLYEQNGQYVAEPVGEAVAIDKTSGTQTITINAESFSTYALRSTCDGEECGYNAFVNMNGFQREAELIRLLGITAIDEGEDDVLLDTYDKFIAHINEFHYEDEIPYCTCSFYQTRYDELRYGSLAHEVDSFTGEYCMWHFSQLTVEDQYTVIKDMTAEERNDYIDTLSEVQKAALNEYIADQEGNTDNLCVVVGNQLMYDGIALANITENGYIIDIATGIAVGRYDWTSGDFTMGTGSN